jgi:hypothetical protein
MRVNAYPDGGLQIHLFLLQAKAQEATGLSRELVELKKASDTQVWVIDV